MRRSPGSWRRGSGRGSTRSLELLRRPPRGGTARLPRRAHDSQGWREDWPGGPQTLTPRASPPPGEPLRGPGLRGRRHVARTATDRRGPPPRSSLSSNTRRGVPAGRTRRPGARGRDPWPTTSPCFRGLATCHRPRRRGRGIESEEVALERGHLDAVIAGLLFMAGMRRSEVSALRWADVAAAADGDGVLVTVRRSKTNQEGETTDVRFVKSGVARAIRTLRAAASPASADRVAPLSPKMVGLRFQAAARPGRRRRARDRPLRARRAGVGAHEPGRVDHRRDARRELEDEPDGRALLGRCNRRARGCGAVPLKQSPRAAAAAVAPQMGGAAVQKRSLSGVRKPILRRAAERPRTPSRWREEKVPATALEGSC